MSEHSESYDIVCTKDELIRMLFGSTLVQIQHELGTMSVFYDSEWSCRSIASVVSIVEFKVRAKIRRSEKYSIRGTATLRQNVDNVFTGKLDLLFVEGMD